MRRALVPLLLALCACGASPEPIRSTSSPSPSSSATIADKPLPSLELAGTQRATELVARDAKGKEIYRVNLGPVFAAALAPDGGAYAVVEEPTKVSPGRAEPMRGVVRLDSAGEESWKISLGGGGWDFRLFPTAERVVVVDLYSKAYREHKRLHVLDAETGKSLKARAMDADVSDVAGRGEVVVVADETRVSRLGPDGEPAWGLDLRLFPSIDPASWRSADRKLAVGFDGTILAGASDGSIVAIDVDGHPRYQLGVRGAISGIDARPDGSFVVSTREGFSTVIGAGGVVSGESAGPPAPRPFEPGIVVDKRGKKDESGAARATSTRRTAAYRVRREGPKGKPFRSVLSVLAVARDDVWVLGRAGVPEFGEGEIGLYHYDGASFTDLGTPSARYPKEVYAEGKPAAAGLFLPTSVARGPKGQVFVVGERVSQYGSRPSILERKGDGFHERRELLAAFSKLPVTDEGSTTYAASAKGREVLCVGKPPRCVEFGAGKAPEPVASHAGERVPDAPEERQKYDRTFEVPVFFAGDTLFRAGGWGLGDSDAWVIAPGGVEHWNGKALEPFDAPLSFPGAIWASARDDVWITGRDGEVVHFDGERSAGVPGAAGWSLSVTGSGRDDVWIFGSGGLFHVTPEADTKPDFEAATASAPPASPPSRALVVAGVDPSYRLERVELPIDGDKPFRMAIGLSTGPGGVIWMHDGARVVEHDGSRTRVLYRAPAPEPFVCWSAPEPDCEVCVGCTERQPRLLDCQRCVAPTGAGEGAMLTIEGWMQVHGGAATRGPTALSALLAIGATPSGSIWSVSAEKGDVGRAMMTGPSGSRLVTGLPPAAYADISARADDDLWLAGGLTTAEDEVRPEGEGTLVHFDGKTFGRHRGPDGALLSVAASGPGEAWAVGLAGGVVHVKNGASAAMHLEREDGERWPVVLRGVAAAGPSEAWMVGDDATLLRWDGKALRRVDAGALGKTASLSAVIAPSATPGWVVGPGGIFRLVSAR